MKTIATSSIGQRVERRERVERVEKPPEDSVVRMWLTASNGPIPARRNAANPVTVSAP